MGDLMGVPMSHVDFKKWQYCMSLSSIFIHVTCRFLKMTMSHVVIFLTPCCMSISMMFSGNFKKRPFRHVEFKSRRP